MLNSHRTTEEEKAEICGWRYEGEYAVYDLCSYEEMKKRQFGLANPNTYVESFLAGNALIGFCTLYDDGNEVFFGIGVNPQDCGKGYGKEMIGKMYAVSKTLFPGKPLYLEVRTWNQRAIRCYESAGFQIDGAVIHQKTSAGEGTFYRMVRA